MLWHMQAIFESKGETSCLPLLNAGFEPKGSLKPNLQQIECRLTNWLSYQGSSWKLELNSPSLWPARIQPTWPHWHLAYAPGSDDTQASDIRIQKRQVVFTYIHTYIHACMHACVRTYVRTYIHTHIHTYILMHIHIHHMHIQIHVHVRVHMHVNVHAHMHLHIHVHIHIHIHIHILAYTFTYTFTYTFAYTYIHVHMYIHMCKAYPKILVPFTFTFFNVNAVSLIMYYFSMPARGKKTKIISIK